MDSTPDAHTSIAVRSEARRARSATTGSPNHRSTNPAYQWSGLRSKIPTLWTVGQLRDQMQRSGICGARHLLSCWSTAHAYFGHYRRPEDEHRDTSMVWLLAIYGGVGALYPIEIT
jgi:hypothetical protein